MFPTTITTTSQQLAALAKLTTAQLRAKYAEIFGQPTRSGNRDWLTSKFAWRVQTSVTNGISERARHQ